MLVLILNIFFFDNGIRNLANNLRNTVETHNSEERESENFDTRRRAINMDKFEEIYDHIVDAKREDNESNVYNKIDIKDTKEYIRVVSGVGLKRMSELQKNA